LNQGEYLGVLFIVLAEWEIVLGLNILYISVYDPGRACPLLIFSVFLLKTLVTPDLYLYSPFFFPQSSGGIARASQCRGRSWHHHVKAGRYGLHDMDLFF